MPDQRPETPQAFRCAAHPLQHDLEHSARRRKQLLQVALAQRLLTEQAHAAYVALEDQAQAVYKRDTLAAGGSLGHEAYAQARDAALHTLRCAQIRALWGLLQDAENVAPIQMPEPFVESKGGAIGIIARI